MVNERPAADFVKKIKLYQSSIKSVKGLAGVKIKTPDNKISYTQVTIAQTPNLLRLEALNPFGKTVGFISSDGTYLYIITPSEKGRYSANETFNLAYIYPGLNLKVTAGDLVDLMLGRIPENVYMSKRQPSLITEGEWTKLTFPTDAPGKDNILWINPTNYQIVKAQVFLKDGRLTNLTYEYFDELKDGRYFPRIIHFSSGDLSIRIKYEDDIELNGTVDNTLLKPGI